MKTQEIRIDINATLPAKLILRVDREGKRFLIDVVLDNPDMSLIKFCPKEFLDELEAMANEGVDISDRY